VDEAMGEEVFGVSWTKIEVLMVLMRDQNNSVITDVVQNIGDPSRNYTDFLDASKVFPLNHLVGNQQ
jgi:hypothetical protein